MSDGNNYAPGARFLSFFTVLLVLTLDAENGKDILDVLVPFIESLTYLNMSAH